MKKTFLLLIYLLSLYSCLNMNEPKEQAKYIEMYKSFDIEMVNHFPKKLPNNKFGYRYSSPKYIVTFYNDSHFYLKTRVFSKEKFEREKELLKKDAKTITKSTDDCVLIISSKEKQKISDCKELIPVPEYLISKFTSEKKERIMLNNEIAVIDFKFGKILNPKSGKFLNLNDKLNEKENLPKKWRNGYSKGYAFDDIEQTITYWLIIW